MTAELGPVLGEQATGIRSIDGAGGRFAKLVRFDVIDSTNRFAVEAARGGEDEGLVVLAGAQTHGRGRRGRTWFSLPGSSLLCSLLFWPLFDIADAHVISTIVGLSSLEAIEHAGAKGALKWPNDVIIDNRKVAGVLAELVEADPSNVSLQGRYAVVAGIGINCSWPENWPPDDVSDELSSLSASATTIERETGQVVAIGALFATFLAGVERRYEESQTTDGRRSIMEEYRRRCATVGQMVSVELIAKTIVATAVGIDDHGRLQLEETNGELTTLDAGDVVHLRAQV